jgi:thioredoxin 1
MKKIFVLILIFTFSNAVALEFNSNFTKEKFKEAQKDGKTVVVYSWNEFCGTCAKQKPILKQAKEDFKDILFLDFEQTKNKEIAKFLSIDYWSTIAVYKNNNQIALAIGLNNKEDIYSLIKEGI